MRKITATLPNTAAKLAIIVLATFALGTATLAQTVYYVSTTGSDSNDGLSWETAKRTIQNAINTATPGSEIRVAQGTYGTITINKSLALKGGYAGAGSDPDARDPVQYPTIIDGGGTATAIQISGSGLQILIEGFIIQNGFSNQAGRGAGLNASGTSPTLRYNLFRNNRGVGNGGAIRIYDSSAVIEYNIFENNSVTSTSAAVNGGAIYIYASLGTQIRHNIFINNSATTTGNNRAGRAGAIYIYESVGTTGTAIHNNLFVNNRAVGTGGETAGGAISIYTGTQPITIYNNTFVGNQATRNNLGQSGSAIWSYQAPMQVRNNIFANYASSAIHHGGYNNTSADTDHNCFFADIALHATGNGAQLGNNNLYQDPLFVDPNNNDFRLQSGSPCRNAGDTSIVNWSTDLAGNPRVREDVVDIGAYEFQPGGGGPQGDVDGNGCVDDADLLQVLFAFGQTGSNPADVNGDSVVDDADLLIVLFNFGQGCGG